MITAHTTPHPAGQTANPWETHKVIVSAITPEIDGVATYHLKFWDQAKHASYRFAPGQFNMLYMPGAGEIAISCSDDPRQTECFAHTIRAAGNVTRALARVQVGQTLGLRGPFGTSWPISQCIGRDVVIVTGGIGLAPLRPMIYALLAERRQFGRLNLLYGARTPDTLLYANQYNDWSQRGMLIQTTVDRSAPGWQGNVGVVTTLLEQLRTFDPSNTTLLCCGPEVMMRYTVLAARSCGLSAQQIWISMERHMQCAIGLCGHCQLGPAFICKDGPVFRFDKIEAYMDVEGL